MRLARALVVLTRFLDTNRYDFPRKRHRPVNRAVVGHISPRTRPLSLAIALKIPIKRAIRGSRPGAERTVSAISPYLAILMRQGQSVRRPVLPPSEHIESF